jgi:predicted dinucleotide-binding enzyme
MRNSAKSQTLGRPQRIRNSAKSQTLVEGKVGGQALVVFIASDDDGAKAAVRQIAEDGGLRAVNA